MKIETERTEEKIEFDKRRLAQIEEKQVEEKAKWREEVALKIAKKKERVINLRNLGQSKSVRD